MSVRVLEVTALTSRLNALPFDDEAARATFLDYAGITIGRPRRAQALPTGEPIVVEENVWIGAGATILPGVTIGHDAVIAAGAVVADVPAQSLVAGPKATVRRTWRKAP